MKNKNVLDYTKYSKEDVFFATLDSYDGERTLSQHGYVDRYIGTEQKGNLSLCGRYVGWDGEDKNSAEEIWTDEHIKDSCCKICLKTFNRLPDFFGTY